jgi:short-subunit dehydrogenase
MLVNNAGLGCFCDFMEAEEFLWRDLMEVNLFAPVFLTRLFLPMMLAQRQGMIVNIASIGGLVAHSAKVSPYVASKHGLVGFSRALAKDLAHTGVKVKAVCPHLTATEFFDKGQGASEMQEAVQDIKNFLDRPEDVAKGILKGLDAPGVILFPTEKPAKAFQKMRDI